MIVNAHGYRQGRHPDSRVERRWIDAGPAGNGKYRHGFTTEAFDERRRRDLLRQGYCGDDEHLLRHAGASVANTD
jgi:hypothetical protein